MWNGNWEDVKEFIQWLYIAVNLSFRGRSEEGRKKENKNVK